MKITYIVHSTSIDNIKGIASGHYDCPLSQKGIQQAHDLKQILCNDSSRDFGIIFSSTLQRALNTATIVFGADKVIQDYRLCEIDFGDYTHVSKQEIDLLTMKYIQERFSNGESFQDVENRVRNFLEDNKDHTHITIVSHRAPQLALEVICNGKTWPSAIKLDWRNENMGSWQTFWNYQY